LHGAYKSYDRSGKMISEVNYKKNVKHGSMVVYDDNGKEVRKLKYKHGVIVKKKASNYAPL